MLLLDVQPSYPMERNAQARNAYGSCAQEIVCAALGLYPIAIDGSCEVCFDAEKDDTFYEIKSAQRASKVVVYDWRIKKEADAGKPLRYAVLLHRAGGAGSSQELWRDMALTATLLVVSAATVHAEAMKQPLKKIGDASASRQSMRFGYSRKGYIDGYRSVPVKNLLGFAPKRHMAEFWLHDLLFTVPVLSE